MSIDDLRNASDSLLDKINDSNAKIIDFKKMEKESYETLIEKMKELNSLNKLTKGSLESQQLANEINANIYQSIEKLTLYLKTQEANQKIEEQRRKLLNSINREREIKEKVQEFNRNQKELDRMMGNSSGKTFKY